MSSDAIDRALKTVVVGIGNRYLSDDGVGPVIAHQLFRSYEPNPEVDILECPIGGLRLMELIAPYQRAIIVDAVYAPDRPTGTIVEFGIDDLTCTKNQTCQHDTNLANAAQFMRTLGGRVPEDIALIGITTTYIDTYGEDLSPAVETAVDDVVELVATRLDLVPAAIPRAVPEEFLA